MTATSSMKMSESKNYLAYVEIGFNKWILDHRNVLRRVRWKMIWGPSIAENGHVVELAEIKRSYKLRVGQCTNP